MRTGVGGHTGDESGVTGFLEYDWRRLVSKASGFGMGRRCGARGAGNWDESGGEEQAVKLRVDFVAKPPGDDMPPGVGSGVTGSVGVDLTIGVDTKRPIAHGVPCAAGAASAKQGGVGLCGGVDGKFNCGDPIDNGEDVALPRRNRSNSRLDGEFGRDRAMSSPKPSLSAPAGALPGHLPTDADVGGDELGSMPEKSRPPACTSPCPGSTECAREPGRGVTLQDLDLGSVILSGLEAAEKAESPR